MNQRLIAILVAASVGISLYHWANPLRPDHVFAWGVLFGLVAYKRTRFAGLVLLPAFLFSFAYDSLRIFNPGAIKRVSLELVPSIERALFGIDVDGQILMPNEAIVAIYNPVLDFISGPVYTSHVVVMFFGAVGFLWAARSHYDDPVWRDRFHSFFWGFLLLNLSANLTQLIWPVAPPWYLDLYGPVVPSEAVPGNAAGLLRWDALTGIPYFGAAYTKASYTFGAMPSLHCAFPTWVALFMRGTGRRVAAWTFALVMGFYAVYLNHHFVLDVLAGMGLAAWSYWMVMHGPLKGYGARAHRWLAEAFMPGEAVVVAEAGQAAEMVASHRDSVAE